MKQKGNFMLRKVMDEYALIPYKETAEEETPVVPVATKEQGGSIQFDYSGNKIFFISLVNNG